MQAAFDSQMRMILGLSPPRKVGMAISGGVDSMALASLATAWARLRGIDLYSFTIDHGLRKGSDIEAQGVKSRLRQAGINAEVLSLNLEGVPQSKMEAVARHGRRRLLSEACHRTGCSTLLHGHHLNDQHELLLLRLLHRSQWYGLAGMTPEGWLDPEIVPGERGSPVKMVKPLLNTPKSSLREWCIENKIEWFEDPTNSDTELTERNRIRRLLEVDSSDLLSPRNLTEQVNLFGKQRKEVTYNAKLALDELLLDGTLVYDKVLEGRARLQLSPQFCALAPAIQTQVLFMVLAQLSPLSVDAIFLRRRQVADMVDRLLSTTGAHHEVTLGLHVTRSNPASQGGNQMLFMGRSRPRASDKSLIPKVFALGSSWSDWHKIDGRWWFRWRKKTSSIPVSDISQTTQENSAISVRLLGDHEEAVRVAKSFLGEDYDNAVKKIPGIRKEISLHPFFSFVDPSQPIDVLETDSVIGFPTLGLVRESPVEFEHKFQKYIF